MFVIRNPRTETATRCRAKDRSGLAVAQRKEILNFHGCMKPNAIETAIWLKTNGITRAQMPSPISASAMERQKLTTWPRRFGIARARYRSSAVSRVEGTNDRSEEHTSELQSPM